MSKNHRPEQDAGLRLKRLRQDIPRIAELLHLEEKVDLQTWSGVMDRKLLPRLEDDFPLVAAICGGGSSGKSTLFNTLINENISPTGSTAGINRRILAAGNIDRFENENRFQELLTPFGFKANRLAEKHELVVPGGPLYILKPGVPSNLILLDTPDFDTGLKGAYTNRDIAQQALEVSDIFIYIFTNANYNNRDNTDFIADMLTRIGTRKCYLIYRVYSSYTEQEITAHARTVARNLYGEFSKEHVLGVFRANEDNRVAAEEAFMYLSPASGRSGPSLADELEKLDVNKLRMDLVTSVYHDVLDHGRNTIAAAKSSRDELHLYANALKATQSHCVQEALQHVPMAPVLKRFTEIWLKRDPAHIRYLRKAGSVVEVPLKAVVKTARWFAGKKQSSREIQDSLQQFSDQIEEDLLSAVNKLWRKAVSRELSVTINRKDPAAREMTTLYRQAGKQGLSAAEITPGEGDRKGKNLVFPVKSHPVVWEAQNRLRKRDWHEALASIVSNKKTLVSISGNIDRELVELADHFRNKMGLLSKIRQTFSAFLTVLPATAAITYILTTGDPVGATGIKVKLTGLFGLKDLYALVAIPATTGLKKADQTQLEALLIPITRTWLDDKLEIIQKLFEEEITGSILKSAGQTLDASSGLIEDIEGVLSVEKK